MKQIAVLLLLLCVWAAAAAAQSAERDSLLAERARWKEAVTKGDALTAAGALMGMYKLWMTVDSAEIHLMTCRTLRLCREKNLDSCYFAVRNERVHYLIRLGDLIFAIPEIQQTLREMAEAEYVWGGVTGYRLMSQIYFTEMNNILGVYYLQRAIQLRETLRQWDHSVSYDYCDIATTLLDMGYTEQARRYVNLAHDSAKIDEQKFYALYTQVQYYSMMGDRKKADGILKTFHDMMKQKGHSYFYETAMYHYYEAFASPSRALAQLDSVHAMQLIYDMDYYKAAAALLSRIPGKERQAYDYLCLYARTKDSTNHLNNISGMYDYSITIDTTLAKIENTALQEKISRYHKRAFTIAYLLLALFVIVIMVYIISRAGKNRRLKKMNLSLEERHAELERIDSDIRREREKAKSEYLTQEKFVSRMMNSISDYSDKLNHDTQRLINHLKEEKADEKITAIIEQGMTNERRIMSDIAQIGRLEYRKESSGTTSPTRQTTDLNVLCKLCVDGQTPKENVNISFTPSEGKAEADIIVVDMMLAVNRVLDNAMKFTQKGTISVKVEKDPPSIVITDTGQGIKADGLQDVFRPFYKENAFSQGAGLGLSVARAAARENGGDVVIQSSDKHGTKVIITLMMAMLFFFPVAFAGELPWTHEIDSISHLIKQRHYILALHLTDRLGTEARRNNDTLLLASTEQLYSRNYWAQNDAQLAEEHTRRCITLIKEAAFDDDFLSHKYSNLAYYCINDDHLEEAREALDMAWRTARNNDQRIKQLETSFRYYMAKDDLKGMSECLRKMEDIPSSRTNNPRLISLMLFYKYTGKNDSAMVLLESNHLTEYMPEILYSRDKAELLASMPGNGKEAYHAMARYVALSDSINRIVSVNMRNDLEWIESHTSQRQRHSRLLGDVRQSRLWFDILSVLLMIAVISVSIWQIVRIRRDQALLRHNADKLTESNDALLKAQERLLRETKEANEAIQRKEMFVRNMSHEIRTPLNSVRGFSEIIALRMPGDTELAKLKEQIENDIDALLTVTDSALAT